MPKLDLKGSNTFRSYSGAGGVVVPSVTEILKVLEGDWMNAFLQRSGRREMNRVMNEAALLGTRVHAVAQMLAWDREAKVKQEMRPYASAIREFLDTHVRKVIVTEVSLCSERLGFGGTIDLIAEMMDGSIAVIDYKTSSSGITKIHRLQTCAYAMLAREAGYRVNKRIVVKIHKKEDRLGQWYARAATSHKEDVETFKACLVVWNFLHGSKLKLAQSA